MRTEREIKLETLPKLEKEKGTLLPLEPINYEYYGLFVNRKMAKIVNKQKMELQKLLAKYHIKPKKCSRKTFRRRK